MNEWKEFLIEDLAEFCNAKRVPLSSMQRQQLQGSYPYYGASGIVDYVNDYIFEGSHVLISEDGENLKSRNTPIAFEASGKFWVNNHAHILKAKEPHLTKILIHYFAQLDLTPYLTGAVQPKLNKATLSKIPLYLPSSTAEQKAIASVLSSLDDKIDLLHRQNKTLEAMAETLFRQWFIEEAKEDWEEKTIGDIFTIKGGGTPSTKEPSYWDGSIAWTSPRDLSTAKSLYMFSTERTITELGLTKVSSGLLPVGTLLMSSRAPIGYLALTDIEVAVNQGYIAILKHDLYSNEFMYLWCKANMELIKNSGNGSVFQEISKASFRELPFVCPPESLLKRFNGYCINWFSKIKLNAKQIQTLENLRDTLLPKLMSGEVRVQYQTEEVA